MQFVKHKVLSLCFTVSLLLFFIQSKIDAFECPSFFSHTFRQHGYRIFFIYWYKVDLQTFSHTKCRSDSNILTGAICRQHQINNVMRHPMSKTFFYNVIRHLMSGGKICNDLSKHFWNCRNFCILQINSMKKSLYFALSVITFLF